MHTLIKITPQTYGYKEEIISFDTETNKITKYDTLHEKIAFDAGKKGLHLEFIKKSKQKLSFDDVVDLSGNSAELDSSSAFDKKIHSSNDIFGMGQEKVKSGGLKRAKSKFKDIA